MMNKIIVSFYNKPNQRSTIMTNSILEYIQKQPPEHQDKLLELHKIILRLLPDDVTQKISWNMPTYFLITNIIHFSCLKHYIGLYPGKETIQHFRHEIEQNNFIYTSMVIQLPHHKPLPIPLIEKIVLYNVETFVK